MDFDEIPQWAEEHPLPTAAIVFGVGLLALWWLGYLGGGSSSGSSGSSLASAYYSAEAAQAVAGTQLQLATVQANRDTAIATTNANAAVAINQAQQTASQNIVSSQTGAQVSEAGLMAQTAQAGITEQGTQAWLSYEQPWMDAEAASEQNFQTAAIQGWPATRGQPTTGLVTASQFSPIPVTV